MDHIGDVSGAETRRDGDLLVISGFDPPVLLQAISEFIWGLVLGITATLLIAMLLKIVQRRKLFNELPARVYHIYSPAGEAAMAPSSADVYDDDELCAICLDKFSEGQRLPHLRCGHLFHRACLQPWLEDHSECPTCRLNLYSGKAAAVVVAIAAGSGARASLASALVGARTPLLRPLPPPPLPRSSRYGAFAASAIAAAALRYDATRAAASSAAALGALEPV